MAQALAAGPGVTLTSRGEENLAAEEAAETVWEPFLPDATETHGAWGRSGAGLSPVSQTSKATAGGSLRSGKAEADAPLPGSALTLPGCLARWAGRRMSPHREEPLQSVHALGGGRAPHSCSVDSSSCTPQGPTTPERPRVCAGLR